MAIRNYIEKVENEIMAKSDLIGSLWSGNETMGKKAARKEIDLIRKGLLSEKGISDIAQLNVGQKERLIKHLDSGGSQSANLVLYPGYGKVVRKNYDYAHNVAEAVKSPNFKILESLKEYQDAKGSREGFARVLGVDKKRALTFHEYVPRVEPGPNYRWQHPGSHPDQKGALEHLKEKGFDPDDYASPGNTRYDPKENRALIIDLSHGRSATSDPRRLYGQDYWANFKSP